MTKGARKAAERIRKLPPGFLIAEAEQIIEEEFAAACQAATPPLDAESIAERQTEQISLLFNGDLSGGTSIRSVLANILRVTLRHGAAPVVSTPPHAYGWCQTQRDNDLCAYCEAHPPTSSAASSTPRCPKCGSGLLVFNGYGVFYVACEGKERHQYPILAATDFAQFFQPAPSPPQWISVKERLPEFGHEVLVWCPTKERRKMTALARFCRFEGDTDYFWDNAYPGKGNLHLRSAVTHWCEFPVPPAPSPQGETHG